jgi:hypothetical protein
MMFRSFWPPVQFLSGYDCSILTVHQVCETPTKLTEGTLTRVTADVKYSVCTWDLIVKTLTEQSDYETR